MIRLNRSMYYGTVLCLLGAASAHATDTYNGATRQLTIPTLTIGSGIYSNVVVNVGQILTPPSGTSPNGTIDNYDPFTGNLTVQSVKVGANTYYNVVASVSSLVSIGSVTGTDTYNGAALTIPSLQVAGGTVYTNAIVTVGTIVSAGGGMPIARDSYNPATQQLTIASIQLGGRVYTNAVVTVAGIVSEGNGYTVSGTVSGLSTGQTLMLVDNGNDYATLQSNGPFTFANTIPFDGAYSVWVYNQPQNLNCTVTNATGNGVIANVTSVVVSCSPDKYTIGGTLNNLPAGQSLTVTDNVNDSLTLTSNGNFTFNNPVAYNGGYSVQITGPAANSQCTASSNTGTGVTANVTSVQINCSPDSYTVGGTLTGLAATEQVTLYVNNSYATTLYANAPFTFPTPLAYGSNYVVTVGSQPSTQICTVNQGSSQNLAANYSGVQVNCSTETYTIGGNVTGLAARAQVTLLDNGGDALTVTGNGAFTFQTPIAYDNNYAVTIGTQPAGQVCSVTSYGTGTAVTYQVTDVAVTCGVPTYTDALNLFASSFATLEITKMLADVGAIYQPIVSSFQYSVEVGCNQAGSDAYAGGIVSLSSCIIDFESFPAAYSYSGSFSIAVGTTYINKAEPSIGTFYPFQGTSVVPLLPNFTITSGGEFSYAYLQSPVGNVTVTGGGLNYEFGSQTYYMSSSSAAFSYTASQLSITTDDFTYDAQAGVGSNTVGVYATILIPAGTGGLPNNPSAGAYLLQNGNTASSCTTLTVTFTSTSQFTLACGGHTYTKNWTDADVAAAFAALSL